MLGMQPKLAARQESWLSLHAYSILNNVAIVW